MNRKLQQEKKINQTQTFCSYPVPVNRKQNGTADELDLGKVNAFDDIGHRKKVDMSN
jgi:hypothetical protein